MREVIRIDKGVCTVPEHGMAAPFDFVLCEGEQIAVVGPNASGKSTLVDLIRGRWRLCGDQAHYSFHDASRPSYKNIRLVSFRDLYGDVAGTDHYYQQRWHSQDVEFSPFLRDIFPPCENAFRKDIDSLLSDGEGSLLDKRVVMLSSGERRRFQIAMALSSAPEVLIMDNPYVGLDAMTRDSLSDALSMIVSEGHSQIIMVLSKSSEIPSFITHVVPVADRLCGAKMTREEYLNGLCSPGKMLSDELREAILSLPQTLTAPEGEIVNMRSVSISYAGKKILDNVNWVVHNGEKWALEGQNGSGKSTLLSLVCADNPQSYACDIDLFGRKRGTGESIWDIKKRIGYSSPEMCRAFQKPVPVINVVASGYEDFAGLYRAPSKDSLEPCRFWMNVFGISDLRDMSFITLSGGQQRLVLLARAFVKNPPLLILDEPMLELDEWNSALAKEVIETFCQLPGKTLVMVSHYREDLPSCISQSFFLKKK